MARLIIGDRHSLCPGRGGNEHRADDRRPANHHERDDPRHHGHGKERKKDKKEHKERKLHKEKKDRRDRVDDRRDLERDMGRRADDRRSYRDQGDYYGPREGRGSPPQRGNDYSGHNSRRERSRSPTRRHQRIIASSHEDVFWAGMVQRFDSAA
eukprot:scaffold342574_cov32-Prasinocladus_malaysianus.AAC.2